MRIVVTGGAGFIGSNLARTLVAAGDQVVVVDDLSAGSKANLEGVAVALLEGSILDRDLLDDAFAGADAVVHLAARGSVPRSLDDPLGSHHANATGTLEVLEAVRRAGKPHLVVASSASVYGPNAVLPNTEGATTDPASPYAVTKVATEQYTLVHADRFDLDALVFRFFNVFGPRQPANHAYAAVVPRFVDAALAGRPLVIEGDGTQAKDFTYVETVTTVIADAVHRRVTSPTPVNLAFGGHVSVRELVETLGRILGRQLETMPAPPRPGDVRLSQADPSRLRALFPGIEPVDLETGLRATVDWFQTRA
ncbi:MAG: NAD-dependent epimerase/dehydratase family protein [Acidobacteria bacterium]|nr:NAD-dependent epimerase/dehydratase family protein [Acidobacteriota bacterium]